METENSTSPEDFVRLMSEPIYASKGWLKFYGIVNILYGVFAALSLVGILVAWIPIWLGALVNGAANQIEKAYIIGDRLAFLEAQRKLRTYFVVQAVLILLGLLFIVSILVVVLTTGLYSHLWDKLHPMVY